MNWVLPDAIDTALTQDIIRGDYDALRASIAAASLSISSGGLRELASQQATGQEPNDER
jgi:hypothetical protein